MKRLAIETSTDLASIALQVDEQVVVAEQNTAQQHTKHLLPMIDRLLSEAGLKVCDLDGIAFGAGPGSFTGLRVACSLAKGLAYAHDLPIYPVGGLLSIAHACFSEPDQTGSPCLALLDARMQQVYWAMYDRHLNEISPPRVADAVDVRVLCDKTLILAGVGLETYDMASLLAQQGCVVQQRVVYPHAHSMLALMDRVAPLSALDALPFYVRNKVTQGNT